MRDKFEVGRKEMKSKRLSQMKQRDIDHNKRSKLGHKKENSDMQCQHDMIQPEGLA